MLLECIAEAESTSKQRIKIYRIPFFYFQPSNYPPSIALLITYHFLMNDFQLAIIVKSYCFKIFFLKPTKVKRSDFVDLYKQSHIRKVL